MLTAEGINAMLRQWINTPEGRASLRKKGVGLFNKEKMRQIAYDLADALYHASISVVKIGHPLFLNPANFFGDAFSGWGVRSYEKQDPPKVRMTMAPWQLQRDSFAKTTTVSSSYLSHGTVRQSKGTRVSGYTGEGVYDIVGLFTQGYTPASGRFTGGLWESQGLYTLSHSLGGSPGLAPNPFVDNVVDAFKIRYSDLVLDVKYPSLWHSR